MNILMRQRYLELKKSVDKEDTTKFQTKNSQDGLRRTPARPRST
jgi:hypothetical protein